MKIVINFSGIGLKQNFILIVVLFPKFYIWKKSGSWDMDQNALRQSLQDP